MGSFKAWRVNADRVIREAIQYFTCANVAVMVKSCSPGEFRKGSTFINLVAFYMFKVDLPKMARNYQGGHSGIKISGETFVGVHVCVRAPLVRRLMTPKLLQ